MHSVGRWLGVEVDEVSWRERLASVAGGGLAILWVILVGRHALGAQGPELLVASMGASAVLVFAVPHGQLSQPWPVVWGHVGSALIGVGCAKVIDQRDLAAACAVGLAIGAMHLCRSVHPPGGATALTAVIGGPAVTSLGWSFVWHPVLLDALALAAFGVLFNCCFPWRRYPAALAATAPAADGPRPSHEDVLAAVRSIDSFVDITEDDLLRLHGILSRTATPTDPADPTGRGATDLDPTGRAGDR